MEGLCVNKFRVSEQGTCDKKKSNFYNLKSPIFKDKAHFI